MNPNYKPIYEMAKRLEYQIKDVADDPNNSVVQLLRQEARALMDDMEGGKNPRSIEARVKTMQGKLSQLRSQGDGAMDFGHIDEFRDSLEDMRRDLRELDNY